MNIVQLEAFKKMLGELTENQDIFKCFLFSQKNQIQQNKWYFRVCTLYSTRHITSRIWSFYVKIKHSKMSWFGHLHKSEVDFWDLFPKQSIPSHKYFNSLILSSHLWNITKNCPSQIYKQWKSDLENSWECFMYENSELSKLLNFLQWQSMGSHCYGGNKSLFGQWIPNWFLTLWKQLI